MAKQFFIAPRIGSGTDADPFRPKVPGSVTGWVGACDDTQCLIFVTGDTSSAEGDSQLVTLIADNLDVNPSTLPANVRNRIQNGLNSKGIPLTFTSYATVRDFLNALGRFFDPNFDLVNFFVAGE
jgi:hypothetical protein